MSLIDKVKFNIRDVSLTDTVGNVKVRYDAEIGDDEELGQFIADIVLKSTESVGNFIADGWNKFHLEEMTKQGKIEGALFAGLIISIGGNLYFAYKDGKFDKPINFIKRKFNRNEEADEDASD